MGKATTLALLLALALPLPSAAARSVAPPGNSEADQYFETLPGPAGPRSPDSTRTSEDAVREGRLAAGTERALQRRGAAGQAVANVVAKTAPAGERGGGGPATAGPATAGAPPPEKQGLGALFSLLLVATAAAALAFALARRRRPAAR